MIDNLSAKDRARYRNIAHNMQARSPHAPTLSKTYALVSIAQTIMRARGYWNGNATPAASHTDIVNAVFDVSHVFPEFKYLEEIAIEELERRATPAKV